MVRSIAFTALALCAAAAHAGWSTGIDVERFRWNEGTSPGVTETGQRYGLAVSYVRERDAGWQFGYRGRLYAGNKLKYEGAFLASGAPATGETDYAGLLNEAQAGYRLPASELGAQFVTGLGWDYWERKILPNQPENYHVVYGRLGFNLDRRVERAFFGGAGIKYPIYTSEDAHLRALGFRDNPKLHPKPELSFYAEAGYRFTKRWSLVGYYDAFRFGESPAVATSSSTIPGCAARCNVVQPASRSESLGLRLQYHFQ